MGEQTGAVPELCEEAAQIKEYQLLTAFEKSGLPAAPSENALFMLMDYDVLSLFPDMVSFVAGKGRFTSPAFTALGEKMESGDTLSAAMKSMPDDFPAYVARMIQVGEEKQDLDEMLERVVAYLKWQHLGIESAVRLFRPCVKA
jgi:hypothetical protein